MYFKLLLSLMHLVLTVCKDVSETERATRAAFVQRLLNKQKYLDGRLKLVGGANKYEGNVYIYHAGRWGAVCDDSWDDAAAAVVCRNFNRTGVATYGSQFGEANEKYWMDDVTCEGDEISLNNCLFSGWGSSDCGADEAAGVVCGGILERGTECKGDCTEEQKNCREGSCPAQLRQRMRVLSDVIDVRTSVRLVGGRSSREGRVEVYHHGIWGSICPDGWTAYEAAVVCRHLALGYAEQALQTDQYSSSRIILHGVKCEGNETNLFLCRQRRVSGCPREVGHVAAVSCTSHLADLHLDVSAIERTAHLQDSPMFTLQCAMEENCLSKSAYEIKRTNENWQFETRRLLRFTAASLNRGDADFRPYLPKHLWQWHLCHMHYHSMEVFATFDVLDAAGRRVAEGHKASFCLEDNTCLSGVERKYSCKNYGDQGVSVNCSDVYQYNIDCQWVDVTDVEPGDYTFKVAVNPHARVAEQSYHNNAATCSLRLTDTYAVVHGCILGRP